MIYLLAYPYSTVMNCLCIFNYLLSSPGLCFFLISVVQKHSAWRADAQQMSAKRTDTFQLQYFVSLLFRVTSDYPFFPNLISSMIECALKTQSVTPQS